MLEIRKAGLADLEAITELYEAVHTEEEAGRIFTGWKRGVYPTVQTVLAGLQRDDYFAAWDGGELVAAAVINQTQVPEYIHGSWKYPAADAEVTVLHTLAVHPAHTGKGYAKAMVAFYEDYARQQNAPYLRMDTQVKNTAARRLYASLGYAEIGITSCCFNGIAGVELVLLEKNAAC